MKKKTSRHQRRTDKTKRQLAIAAKSLFAEKGFDLTTIDDITERADTGKGTFYYHFRTKEKLINNLIENVLNGLEESIDRHCSDVGGIEELLDHIINAHIDFFRNRWEDFVLYFQARADIILDQGYDGIDTPFIRYIDAISRKIDMALEYNLSKPARHRVASAITGFIYGYYSFSTISSNENDDIEKVFQPVRGALVSSLVRFIKTVNKTQNKKTKS